MSTLETETTELEHSSGSDLPAAAPRKTVAAAEFWAARSEQLVIDVRSPGEFANGHIPNAVNVPLFDNDERAEVGTLYKKRGHDPAVLRGLEIVGPKMAGFARTVAELNRKHGHGGKNVAVHCWRGGMRSQSFAWLLETTGWTVTVLDGGYKAFRRLAHDTIEKTHRLVVLSGLTGAGKTVHLQRLRDAGEQVVDLERLANHRGSAFGGVGQGEQPKTEQFENDLFVELEQCDPDRRIWVEDEGKQVGAVVVPHLFHQQVRNAPAVFLDVPQEVRVGHLMEEYGELDPVELIESLNKIRKRFGPQHATAAIELVQSGDVRSAIQMTLAYYDRTYLHCVKKMPRQKVAELKANGIAEPSVVAESIRLASRMVG